MQPKYEKIQEDKDHNDIVIDPLLNPEEKEDIEDGDVQIYQQTHDISITINEPHKALVLSNQAVNKKNVDFKNSRDGVFANMSAKPEIIKPETAVADLEKLPDYTEAMEDPSPPQFDSIHGENILEYIGDDVLIDGMPIGGIFSFFWNMLISSIFQIVGFLLTYLLHLNYAGKYGSCAGLGITFLQYGFYLRTKINDSDKHKDQEPEGEGIFGVAYSSNYGSEHIPHSGLWLSYLLMLVGWIIIIKSCTEYLKLRKIQSSAMASAQSVV